MKKYFKDVSDFFTSIPKKVTGAYKSVSEDVIETFDSVDDIIVEKAFKAAISGTLWFANRKPSKLFFDLFFVVGIYFEVNCTKKNLLKFSYFLKNPPKNNDEVKKFLKALKPRYVAIYFTGGLSLGIRAGAKIGGYFPLEQLVGDFDNILIAAQNRF